MKGHQPPAPLSAHRLARFTKLARLWLLRVGGWLIAVAGLCEPLERAVEAALKPFSKKMTWVVCTLIVLMAQAHLPAPEKARAGGKPRRLRGHVHRSLLGARLRKLVKARDPRGLIAALLMALNDAEAHAKRLAKRLRNGLNRRLGGFKVEPRAVSAVSVCVCLAPAADTS